LIALPELKSRRPPCPGRSSGRCSTRTRARGADLLFGRFPAMPGNRLATAEAPTCCRRGH
jgi:hypothetical protein